MKSTKILAASLAATSLLAAAGCADKNVSDSEYIANKGTMVIGYTIMNPLNYTEGDGELTGFETEFASAVCEKLGYTPEFRLIEWDSKEMELNSKTIDCIWNGMTITDERKENMSVTVPYMENRQVLVVRNEDVDKYSASLDGAKVVAEAGSAGEMLAEEHADFANAQYTPLESQATALMEVAAHTSDIAVIDYIMALGSVGEGTDFSNMTFIDNDYEGELYGAAFRKGSDVTEKVNAAIKELKKEGKLDEIAAKYELDELIAVE